MKKIDNHLETLNEIRSIMERSSRFISLSGFSGVFAGIYALLGVLLGYFYMGIHLSQPGYYKLVYNADKTINKNFILFFIILSVTVMVLSVATAVFLSIRKAKKLNVSIWDKPGKYLLRNLSIPLTTGGIFCLILMFHGLYELIAPAMLIFYGLSLVNAGKYAVNEIGQLGICEILIGLTACFFLDYGLLFWATGFGILHLVYGIIMYYRHEV